LFNQARDFAFEPAPRILRTDCDGNETDGIVKRAKLKFHRDKHAAERPLTLREKLINEKFWKAMQPEARRRRENKLPTLAEIEMAKFLWPERQRILALQDRCRNVFAKNATHWTVKITSKLDRLTFPELTQCRRETEQEKLANLTPNEFFAELYQGKKRSDHKRLARLLAALKAACAPKSYPELFRNSLFGIKLTKIIMDAVWKLDDLFLIEFGKAIETESRADCKKARIYRFLLQNAEAVEECRTVTEIRKLPGFPPYDVRTFYKLCKEVGLPLAK
jgi:hypothetical protein